MKKILLFFFLFISYSSIGGNPVCGLTQGLTEISNPDTRKWADASGANIGAFEATLALTKDQRNKYNISQLEEIKGYIASSKKSKLVVQGELANAYSKFGEYVAKASNGETAVLAMIKGIPDTNKAGIYTSIGNLGDDASRFLDDIASTVGVEGKLGGELGKLDEGLVDAWGIVKENSKLSSNTLTLEVISESIKQGYKTTDQLSSEFKSAGNKLWTKIDDFDGLFNGKHATYFDINVIHSPRERVGMVLEENGILEFHLNIPDYLQKQGVGANIVKRSIDELFPEKIKGWWKESEIYTQGGESVNLTIFKKKILEEGMGELDAVFETPTGKLMKENGFDGTPIIIKNTLNEVIVHFTPSN